MATKVNPWNGKGLGKESVRKQFTTSLESMKVQKVQILYLHAPDHDTPLLETLAEVNALHKEGKFNELGLSNYSAWVRVHFQKYKISPFWDIFYELTTGVLIRYNTTEKSISKLSKGHKPKKVCDLIVYKRVVHLFNFQTIGSL